MERTSKASRNLGIISLCTGWFIPLLGIVLSIIGLSIQKDEAYRETDITLNILGMIVSVLFWIFWYLFLYSIF